MNGRHLGAIFVGLALLGACGGSASRAGRGQGPSEGGGEAGVAGAPSDNETHEGGRSTGEGGSSDAGGGSSGAIGGDPAGSGPVVGGAGAGGEQPSLPLPPGCEARAATETSSSCSLSAYCSVQSQVTSCGQLPSGRWQCGCELYNRERTFEVEGATGLRACAVAAGLCGADESDMAEESCVTRSDDSSDDTCRINLGCSREVEIPFAPEARAWLVRNAEAECYRSESSPALECGCMYRGKHRTYEILSESATLACRPFVDFCMSEAEPDFSGEERCLEGNPESTDEGCQQARGCANPMPLADGVDLARLETRYAICRPGLAGGAECSCDAGAPGMFDFHTDDAPNAASCAFASAACTEGAEIERAGDVSCEAQTADTTEDSWCTVDLACEQPATVDGAAIIGKGRLIVQCARSQEGQPWRCSCASDQTIATFRLGAADASATEACDQAPLSCLEHLELHLGPYGEVIYPPYPLPP